MSWRVAGSLERLLQEINAKFPNRSRASDGSIGDAAHASRASDHNPYIKDGRGIGVVRARDFTHDPRNGFDSYKFARSLARSNDKRIKYIISNGEIWNPSVSQSWRHYSGSNPHDHHAHVSVDEGPQSVYDDQRDWSWEADYDGTANVADRPPQPLPTEPVLRRGMKGDAIKQLQTQLKIKADGDFGPATERAVKAFQTARGLGADGIVGVYTWKALKAAAAISTPAAPPETIFDRVMEYVIDDEGDELNTSPSEPGGASRFGISIDALSRFLKRQATLDDLRSLTPASAAQIYKKLYAEPIGFDKLPAGLNYAALDFAINSGIANVDQIENQKGIKDALTLALKEVGVIAQIDRLCDLRLEHMKRSPNWSKYKNGWQARVSRVRNRAYNLAK